MELITPQEKVMLEERLSALKANRPQVTQRIAEARALGDLKENGDYHAAREQQGMEEAEIRRLEDRLSRAQVVDVSKMKDSGVVFLGSTVRLRDLSSKKLELVRLVGELSPSPPDDYDEVTASSPMGESLMKARVGETIRFAAPRGEKRYEIVEIVV